MRAPQYGKVEALKIPVTGNDACNLYVKWASLEGAAAALKVRPASPACSSRACEWQDPRRRILALRVRLRWSSLRGLFPSSQVPTLR